MQNAETVLGVLRERGRRGLPLNELYRQLFNPQLYLLAYGRIYSDKGAMTPGAPGRPWTACRWARSSASSGRCVTNAVDGARSSGSTSRRRTGSGGRSACHRGRTSWSARWCASCWTRTTMSGSLICPTVSVLAWAADAWTGTTWFVEGDVADCFGSFDHEVMLSMLATRVVNVRAVDPEGIWQLTGS